jgi:hypothetical protein
MEASVWSIFRMDLKEEALSDAQITQPISEDGQYPLRGQPKMMRSSNILEGNVFRVNV